MCGAKRTCKIYIPDYWARRASQGVQFEVETYNTIFGDLQPIDPLSRLRDFTINLGDCPRPDRYNAFVLKLKMISDRRNFAISRVCARNSKPCSTCTIATGGGHNDHSKPFSPNAPAGRSARSLKRGLNFPASCARQGQSAPFSRTCQCSLLRSTSSWSQPGMIRQPG